MRVLVNTTTGDKITFEDAFDPFEDAFDHTRTRTSVTICYVTKSKEMLHIPTSSGSEMLSPNTRLWFGVSTADRLYSHLWLMGWSEEKETKLPPLTSINR